MSAPPYGGRLLAPSAEECVSVAQFITLTQNAATLILVSSYKRRGILLSVDTNNITYLSNTKQSANQMGFPILSNGGLYYFCRYQHGDIVQKPWWAFTTVAGVVLGIIEVMEP